MKGSHSFFVVLNFFCKGAYKGQGLILGKSLLTKYSYSINALQHSFFYSSSLEVYNGHHKAFANKVLTSKVAHFTSQVVDLTLHIVDFTFANSNLSTKVNQFISF